MEYNTYTKGKNSIQATETAWELLYKDKGYKPAKDTAPADPAGGEDGADDDGNGGGTGDNGEGGGTGDNGEGKNPTEK